MENKNLDQIKLLINRIADLYDPPPAEQTEEMRILTGRNWSAEDLKMACFEYWSHHSLDETAYMLLHGDYPPVCEEELVFWRYKPGVRLDGSAVYEKYRFGRGASDALEPLPLKEIIQNINESFPGWEQNTRVGSDGRSWRFDSLEQAAYWTDTHFWIFEYGRETQTQREHQILCFSCHNMTQTQILAILKCMERFQCALHIRESAGRE